MNSISGRTLVHKGSTKDVYRDGDHLVFNFSDRYSVFDWGEMPDHVPSKGLALAKFTKKIYRALEEKGVRTHLLEIPVADNEIAVRPYEVVRGTYTSMKQEENLFIPLEVIFRLGVARGSSLLKRSAEYQEGQRFDQPMIEFTTKLERFDRPLTHEEAKLLGGFRDGEWKNLLYTTKSIALFLNDVFLRAGIELWDGKVEFAFGKTIDGNRTIVLVDSIGPDELRLSKDGVQLSKEIMRQYYRKTSWFQIMEAGKKEFGIDFKNRIPAPDKLPTPFLEAVSYLYTILAAVILSDDKQVLASVDKLLPMLKEYK
jgi:phosphoribosylaminoimidazole-succinocarboxamide synthase